MLTIASPNSSPPHCPTKRKSVDENKTWVSPRKSTSIIIPQPAERHAPIISQHIAHRLGTEPIPALHPAGIQPVCQRISRAAEPAGIPLVQNQVDDGLVRQRFRVRLVQRDRRQREWDGSRGKDVFVCGHEVQEYVLAVRAGCERHAEGLAVEFQG